MNYTNHVVYLHNTTKQVKIFFGKYKSGVELSSNLILEEFDFYNKILRVFSAVYLPRKYFLTDREEQLMILLVSLIVNGDRKILSKDNLPFFQSNGFKNKKVLQVWLPKLADKNWIVVIDEKIYLQSSLEEFIKESGVSFKLELVKKEKNEKIN